MCDKCDEIEKKIAQYYRFLKLALDPLTVERMREAVAQLQKHKEAIQH
jgi:hypothetical protein